MIGKRIWTMLVVAGLAGLVMQPGQVRASEVLVEAESFSEHGGWVLDTQFIEIMGSPYLLAHGLGVPVADAVTTVTFPAAGEYRLWVRTKDWARVPVDPAAPEISDEEKPGRFQVVIDGEAVGETFGVEDAEWHWQDGGTVAIGGTEAEVRLRDLTGFDGRCDAILFSSDADFVPDNTSEVLPAWRRAMLGLPDEPEEEDGYDLVVVGGGYAGMGTAVSAARMGIKVALIQNRDVLGGNGSSEVRVWAKGNTPEGLYPVGDIIRELEDTASASPSPYAEWEDDKKERILRNEKNLSLFLGHHVFDVEMESKTRIGSVLALETRTSRVIRFSAPLFADCTGHGYVGMWAGADLEMKDGGRMGMSNMWMWEETEEAEPFPETPWALHLEEGEFPYPTRHHAPWFWEGGYDQHPLEDLELIRDWNLRASYGAWNAIKNRGVYAPYDESGKAHANTRLVWMAYVGGTRETQQLLGDVVLTEQDILEKREFKDGCVLTTWSVDLHYPKEEYLGKYAENPFISVAVHNRAIDKKIGYPVPYRCFYSRNIENLFMSGRNMSVTHEALGTVRVMKTLGMAGVVVGKAASICADRKVSPREVYELHWDEMEGLLQMPGAMRRDNLDSPFYEDTTLTEMAPIEGMGLDAKTLPGIVIDDTKATLSGNWKEGQGVKGYVGRRYMYHSAKGEAEARYAIEVPESGEYEVRVSWQAHENRSSKTPVTVTDSAGEAKTVVVNQREKPHLQAGFYSLGRYQFEEGKAGSVVFTNEGVDGSIHVDAVQLMPVE